MHIENIISMFVMKYPEWILWEGQSDDFHIIALEYVFSLSFVILGVTWWDDDGEED